MLSENGLPFSARTFSLSPTYMSCATVREMWKGVARGCGRVWPGDVEGCGQGVWKGVARGCGRVWPGDVEGCGQGIGVIKGDGCGQGLRTKVFDTISRRK